MRRPAALPLPGKSRRSRAAAAAEILVKQGLVPHLLFEAPDMGEITLLPAAEQRGKVGQRGGMDALPRRAHCQEPLFGKDHVGQHVVRSSGGADKADCGIRIMPPERIAAKIGKRGVIGTHGPVKSRKVKATRLGEGLRPGGRYRA